MSPSTSPSGSGPAAKGSLVLTPFEDLRGFALHHAGRLLLLGITCSSVLAIALIFYFVLRQAMPFILHEDIKTFLTGMAWYPQAETPKFGAATAIVGTLYVTAAATIFAVPVGLLAALCLSDVVAFNIRQIVKPVIEILAAIPSVAYGVFAVLIVAPWLQRTFGLSTGTNALNASMLLAVMALPTIISVAEDAISATGRHLREASYSLGATRAETLFRTIVPAAHSGIIAAVVLGMMRAHRRDHGGVDGRGQCQSDPASLVGPEPIGADPDGHDCRGDGRNAQGHHALLRPVLHGCPCCWGSPLP